MPILSKPYVITDAGRQSEDIDRMFDDVYTEMAELEREQAESGTVSGGGASGIPGRDGEEPGDPDWPMPVTRSSTSLVDTTNLARLNAIQSFTAANTWTATGNDFDELLLLDKGLTFAAVQVASAGANDLDDYEEGTWTPVIGGSGGQSDQVYTAQAGFYVKIGKVVFVQGYAQLSTEGTITGFAEMQGLPFTSENTSNQFAVGTMQWANLATTWVSIVGRVGANASVILLMGAAAAATANNTQLSATDIGNTTFFIFTQMYRASA